jgi:hypothetical protein
MTPEEAKKLILKALQKEDLRILMKENSNGNGSNSGNELPTQYQNKNARKFVCCVDGTEGGDVTFHTMTHLMRKRDYIAILHSPDEDGKGSTFDDSSGMKHHYESQLLRRGLPPSNFLFQVEPKGNLNTLSVLKRYMSLFNSHQKLQQKVTHAAQTTLDSSFLYEIPPDFILLAYDSWKGQSSLSTTPSGASASAAPSSTSDLVMRTLHIPCIICKKRFPDLNHQVNSSSNGSNRRVSAVQSLTYVMAIDDTETSLNGLEILLQLLKSTDRLVLIHIHYPLDAVPSQFLAQLNAPAATPSRSSAAAAAAAVSHSEHPHSGSASGASGGGGSVRQGGLSQFLSSSEKEDKAPSATVTAGESGPHHSSTARRSSRGTIPSLANPLTKYYPLPSAVKEQYLEILREYGPRVAKNSDYDQMLVELSSPSTEIQDIRGKLVDYVNNISPDFFVIAPKNQRKLTSFTEFILTEINTSVILCKN